jgi:hypothetical protein
MKTKTGATLGMVGSYNSNSSPQLALIQSSMTFIEKAIEVLDIIPSPFPLIIADFGSSHGSNSIYVIKLIIDFIEKLKKIERSFLIIHNDLPTNDWKSLFDVLNHQDKTFFGLANGRSFYEQCLPSNSLTIGYSSASVHWLSRKPCNISNHCISVFAQGEELQAFKSQARDDYRQFLENRSRELVQGGVLILIMNCLNEQGLTLFESVYNLLYKCAKLIFSTEEELINYTIPVYIRSYDECVDEELFEKYSFELIQSGMSSVDIKLYDQWKNGEMSLEQYSQAQTGFIQCATESVLRETLEMDETRSKEEINQLSTQFWDVYRKEIEENPHDFQIQLYQTYVVLKKM